MPSSSNLRVIHKVKANAIYFCIVMMGLIGAIILFSAPYSWVLTNKINAMKYPGYPAIALFNKGINTPVLAISKDRGICPFGNSSCHNVELTGVIGDTITVELSYKNTSFTIAKKSVIYVSVKGDSSGFAINGGIASLSGPRLIGKAHIDAPYREWIDYVRGSSRLYKNGSTIYPDEHALYTTGYPVGDIKPNDSEILTIQYAIGKPK